MSTGAQNVTPFFKSPFETKEALEDLFEHTFINLMSMEPGRAWCYLDIVKHLASIIDLAFTQLFNKIGGKFFRDFAFFIRC
jgi:hypothetical protein